MPRCIVYIVLLFSDRFSSIANKPLNGGVPLIGADITLACNPTEKGFPEDVLGVNWYRGGEMISEGEKYERSTTFE